MTASPVFRVYDRPILKKPVLIVGWIEDASRLSLRSADFLIHNLGCTEFAEILPEGFFPLAGVNVEDDVANFPESKFYVSKEHNLIVFKSNVPRTDWHQFLKALLEVGHEKCGAEELYTMGTMISYAAHTMPRVLISIVNHPDMKAELEPYNVMSNTDFDTPAGQKPTLSSYLSWVAGQEGVKTANLWVPIPFYLVTQEDPRACKRLLYFFNSRHNLGLDLRPLDDEVAEQNNKIAGLFKKSPQIEALVRRLEVGEPLESEDAEKLAGEMAEALRKK